MKLFNALIVATLAAKGGKKKAGKYRDLYWEKETDI